MLVFYFNLNGFVSYYLHILPLFNLVLGEICMQKKSLKYLFSVGCLCLLSVVPLLGAGHNKSIKASLSNQHKYIFNGQQVMKGVPVIRYDGQYHAPVHALGNVLGYDVKSKGNETSFTSPKPPTAKPITLNDAVIISIDFSTTQIVVYPKGKSNTPENQIVLNITPETLITNSTGVPRYKITDLNTSMVIQVTYSPAMTKSIPPQTNAIKIVAPISSIQPR